MIFNMSGGGGTGLNFTVVGGTAAPSNPKENTIWVDTDTEITSWDFSAMQPCRRSKSKNLIVYPYYHTTQTDNGVTYTDSGDGTVKANGTAADATSIFRISATNISTADNNILFVPAGTYTLSGCPSGGSDNLYFIEVYEELEPNTDLRIGRDYGNGLTFTLDHDAYLRFAIAVASNVKVTNSVFKPQLEKGSAATSFVKGDATGQVWITPGTSSPVAFNALKKNSMMVYPLSAKQYISGAWVSVDAKSFQSGEWKAWIVYLYNNGDECEAISGGFAACAYTPSGVTSSSIIAPTLSKGADSMTVSISQYYYGQVFAKNSFPLDDISAIEVVYSNASTGTFLVTNTKGTGYTAAASAKPSGSGTAVIDVSNLTGDYYFAISMAYTAGSVTIHEIRLV